MGINKLRIKIHLTVPLERPEAHMNLLELAKIGEPLEHAEIQVWLHVEDSLLAIVESNLKGEILAGNDTDH